MSSEGPTEEQLRAYEEELSRVTSTQIAVQAAASLLNIGGRRLGLMEGHEQERDLDQVRDAIDGVTALMPILERRLAAIEVRQLREALSQLQMGYARLIQAERPQGDATQGEQDDRQQQPQQGGAREGGAQQGGAEQGGAQQGPGPAESSGRLWVPGR